jgi:hypothetical protein
MAATMLGIGGAATDIAAHPLADLRVGQRDPPGRQVGRADKNGDRLLKRQPSCSVSPATVRNLIGWHWIIEPWCEIFWDQAIGKAAR